MAAKLLAGQTMPGATTPQVLVPVPGSSSKRPLSPTIAGSPQMTPAGSPQCCPEPECRNEPDLSSVSQFRLDALPT